MKRQLSLFITGTDTDVGKTVVTAILGLAYQEKGINVGYFKPVQSGATCKNGKLIPPDAEFCRQMLNLDIPAEQLCGYIFEPPVSPHLAAKWARMQIDPAYIKARYDLLAKQYETLLVEGTGGLLVPLAENYFIRELVKALHLPLIIVARPGLGTLNHTLLTLECARQSGIKIAGVIINRAPTIHDPVVENNIETIAKMGKTKILAVIPDLPSLERQALSTIAQQSELTEVISSLI